MRDPSSIKKLQQGLATIDGGWTKPLEEEIQQLEAELAGLAAQLTNPVGKGKPACYVGHRLFEPQTDISFAVDTEQDGASANLCNYVVKDGQDYRIPVAFSGPGVFLAKYLQVRIYQRFFAPAAAKAFWCPVSTLIDYTLAAAPATVGHKWTTKFMVYPKQPNALDGNTSPGFSGLRKMNYFWNVLDTRSGRYFSDDLVPHLALLPRLPPNPNKLRPQGGYTQFSQTRDGGFLKFRGPGWLFERDAQAAFVFRPITPVLQFDSSIAGNNAAIGLPYDDREQGVRRQSVAVQVEFHGVRYETTQDALRAGAVVTL